MAGVKTKRTGASKPTKFTPTPCEECGQKINVLADAYRVMQIKETRKFVWMHRKCTGFGGK
jgi:hypothetical protein